MLPVAATHTSSWLFVVCSRSHSIELPIEGRDQCKDLIHFYKNRILLIVYFDLLWRMSELNLFVKVNKFMFLVRYFLIRFHPIKMALLLWDSFLLTLDSCVIKNWRMKNVSFLIEIATPELYHITIRRSGSRAVTSTVTHCRMTVFALRQLVQTYACVLQCFMLVCWWKYEMNFSVFSLPLAVPWLHKSFRSFSVAKQKKIRMHQCFGNYVWYFSSSAFPESCSDLQLDILSLWIIFNRS